MCELNSHQHEHCFANNRKYSTLFTSFSDVHKCTQCIHTVCTFILYVEFMTLTLLQEKKKTFLKADFFFSCRKIKKKVWQQFPVTGDKWLRYGNLSAASTHRKWDRRKITNYREMVPWWSLSVMLQWHTVTASTGTGCEAQDFCNVDAEALGPWIIWEN